MTVDELCEVFSNEISGSFNKSAVIIGEKLFHGITDDMAEQAFWVRLGSNAMILSANLAVQVMLRGFVEMGIIDRERLGKVRLKPDVHLVKPGQPDDPPPEEKKGEEGRTVQFRAKTRE